MQNNHWKWQFYERIFWNNIFCEQNKSVWLNVLINISVPKLPSPSIISYKGPLPLSLRLWTSIPSPDTLLLLYIQILFKGITWFQDIELTCPIQFAITPPTGASVTYDIPRSKRKKMHLSKLINFTLFFRFLDSWPRLSVSHQTLMNGSLKAIQDDFDITSDKCLYSGSISKKSSILAFHQLIQIR